VEARGRVARYMVIVLAAVVSAAGLAACTAAPSVDQSAQPASTAADLERTSGPLADGLEIIDGSALLGTVFQFPGGVGWAATLRIDGDPPQLVDAYREQVEAVLGVPMRPASATGCGPQFAAPPFELLCRSGAATSAHWVGLRA
jgi:hypothetical protein